MKIHFLSTLLMILFLAACSNESEETADAGDAENVTEEAAGEETSSDSETSEEDSTENRDSNDAEEENAENVTADETESDSEEKLEASEEQSESEDGSAEKSDVNSEQGEQSDDDNEDIEDDANAEEAQASDAAQLSDQEKAALIMMDNRSSDYTFSADELINQRFQLMAPGAPENSQTAIFDLVLQDYGIADGISGLPEGMVIYNITPGYGNFASFIGFNDETAVVYGSQYNVQTYDEILAGGIELDLEELYNRHGTNSNLQQVADKISITNEIDTGLPVTAETAAKIWAFAKSESTEGIESLHFDMQTDPVNPYQPEATVSYPPQTYVISSSPTACGGLVVFTMNADGSFRIYDAPTRFSNQRWTTDPKFSREESAKILNASEVYHVDDLEHLYTRDILNVMIE